MCLDKILEWFKTSHGYAKIVLPVNYPSVVETGMPFSIQYTIKNIGKYPDRLWGKLLVDGKELPNSYWKKRVKVDETVTKTYHHTGIKEDTVIILQTGF